VPRIFPISAGGYIYYIQTQLDKYLLAMCMYERKKNQCMHDSMIMHTLFFGVNFQRCLITVVHLYIHEPARR
jgi:hypothetical protein